MCSCLTSGGEGSSHRWAKFSNRNCFWRIPNIESTHAAADGRLFFGRGERRRRDGDAGLLLDLLPVMAFDAAKHDRVVDRSTAVVVDRLKLHQIRIDLPGEVVEVVAHVPRATHHL